MADSLTKWAMRSPPGARRCYYRGFLMADVERKTPEGRAVRALGQEAWRLGQSGIVALVQQRLGDATYDYIAIRVGRKWQYPHA